MDRRLSEAELAYAAGFFDGEGNVDIRHRQTMGGLYSRYELRLSVAQVDQRPLRWLKERFGGKIYERTKYGLCPWWFAAGFDARAFLRAIAPYLIVKSEQVAVALKFSETFQSDQGFARKGRRGFYRQTAEVIAERHWCFEEIRAIRGRLGIKSRSRNPVLAAPTV